MLLSGSLQNGDSAVPPAIWKVLSLLDRPSAFLLCCSLDGKSIWALQKEMFLRAGLENGRSEPVPSERGERVLLLWRCCWPAVQHRPLTAPARGVTAPGQRRRDRGYQILLRPPWDPRNHQGWFWSLPRITKAALSGLPLLALLTLKWSLAELCTGSVSFWVSILPEPLIKFVAFLRIPPTLSISV